jgi:hypothetical protein
MQINVRPIGNFLVQFLGVEEVVEQPGKFRLNFAANAQVSGVNKRMSPSECKDFVGSNFRVKMNKEELSKIRHLLKIDGIYLIEAAVDSYSLENGANGIWFQLLDLQAADDYASNPVVS